tara:strand:- start:942 stop:2138 length:1197 start_codon:yes stop_codon:yes gene_type:complete
MSYIGKTPATGNFVKLDAISVVNGQASYTMQSGSVNFTPESANHMLVSLNGVIQAPITSFSVSGSTITFASALSTGDVINFIMVYGNVLDIGTPSDDTISTAKLQNTSVTADKLATDSVIEAKIQNNAVTKNKANFVSTGTGYTGTGLDIKGSGSANGRLGLLCSAGTHGVAIESPDHSAGQSYTIKLPDNQIAVDKMIKIKTISGSGNTAIGQAEFVDAPSGAMSLLHTATGSNVSSIDINGYFTSDYDHYKLIYTTYPATNNTDSIVRIMQSGSVVTSSNYWYAGMGMYRASGVTSANSDGSNGANHWRISSSDQTNNAQYPTTGEMLLSNPLSTTHNTTFTTTNIGYNSGGTPSAIRVWTFAGQYVDASASSGISFQYDGGNIYGTIRLYGIVNS